MQVNWKAVAIDAALVVFIIVGVVAVHTYRASLHKAPLAPVTYAPLSPAVTPTVPPAVPVVKPPAAVEHAVKKVVKQPRLDCSKVRSAASGYSKQDIETYGRQYGLTEAQLKEVRVCL